MKTAIVAAALIIIGICAAQADPRHPDWPCHQLEVQNLSVAAFWTGPAVDDVGDAWRNDQAVSDLVLKISARRTPLSDAEKAAADFITGTPDEKRKKAKLVIAGAFATLSSERNQVVTGIKRFAARQQELRDMARGRDGLGRDRLAVLDREKHGGARQHPVRQDGALA